MGQKHHGEMLKRLCQMQGYTQEAIAEKLNVKLHTIKRWYRRERFTGHVLSHLEQLEFLDISVFLNDSTTDVAELQKEVSYLKKLVKVQEKSINLLEERLGKYDKGKE